MIRVHSIYFIYMLEGEPRHIAMQIEITKHFRVGGFEILLRKA